MGKEKRQTKKESEIKREKEEHVGRFYLQTDLCIHIHKVIHKKTFYELAFKNTLFCLHTYVYISLF